MTFLSFRYLLFLNLIFCLAQANGQVVINEVCPSNVTTIQNFNGDYDDWIEIYNSGSSSLNLNGYGLTDDLSNPFKFTFPSVNLPAGSSILIFASDTNSTTVVDHWEMAVDAEEDWRYWPNTTEPDTNWRNPGFNTTGWSQGHGGIGFGDNDDQTTVSVRSSVMMRQTFNVPDTSQVLKAVFFMDYDDGFVAYLNGTEIARANMIWSGPRPVWNQDATNSHEALMYQGQQPDSFYIDFTLLKSLLRQGTNVLAVETHNVTPTSGDLSSIPYLLFGMKGTGTTFLPLPPWFQSPSREYMNADFKLKSTGETVYLFTPGGSQANAVTFPDMAADHSYGRKPNGSGSFCYMQTPTPSSSNNSATCYSGYTTIPLFSLAGGFYSNSITVSISTTFPSGVIRYTLNGDEPSVSDPVYSGPLTIGSTSVVRARVFASGFLPGPVVTNNYFINEPVSLPVWCINTDSLNLWDYNTGIYVMGPNAEPTTPYFGANFWQDWEKPASIKYFDSGRNLLSEFDADIRIYGNYSRAKPQKSFEIKLGDRYGTGQINYPFWSEKPFADEFDDIILRNSGTDWNVLHFRDALMQRIMKPTFSGWLAAEPVALFLNGSFWGVYTHHENHDENFMNYNFGYKSDEIDYLKESGSTIEVKEGTDASFWSLYNYAVNTPVNSPDYYQTVNSMLDLENYADYFIAETFYNNGDWIGEWTNNIKMWRPNHQGGRWRYLLYDTDFGLGLKGSVTDNRLSFARDPIEFSYSSELFDRIVENSQFQSYFINRYADLLNTVFLRDSIETIMDHFLDKMSPDMPAHFAKWGSNTSEWQSNINDLLSFADARPGIVRQQIRSMFGLQQEVTLTLEVSPPGAGRVEISTVIPTSYPWTGIYFRGNPVRITAIPNPGYSFDHWSSNHAFQTNNPNQSVIRNFTQNDNITAHFNGSAITPSIIISEFNYNSDSASNSGDWIEMHNFSPVAIDISGWALSDESDNNRFVFPTGTVLPAGGYLVVSEDTAAFRGQFPSVTEMAGKPLGFNLSNAGEQIRLFGSDGSLFLSFYYQDIAPWPVTADGGGYTCELLNLTGDPNDGANWYAGCPGGSPGRASSGVLSGNVTVNGNSTICAGNSVVLSTDSIPGYTYQWRFNNNPISGATTSSYSASVGGNYSVTVTSSGCSTTSTPQIVTVVSQGPLPVTSPSYRCGSGTVLLTATSTDTVFWYDAPNGNLIGIGDTLITPHLIATTDFYARTSRICPSLPVQVSAQVLTPAAAPVTSNTSRCGPGTVTLTATDTADIRWYTTPTGGALLANGTSFTTGFLDRDTIFYAEAGSICPSPRVDASVTIQTTDPPVISDAMRCGTGQLTLAAASAHPVSWYDQETGGSVLFTGNNFITPVLAATDTFFAEANALCPSIRMPVIANIEPIPLPPTASDSSRCGAGAVTLSAISSEQVYWYDQSSGGTLLSTGSNFTTPSLSSSTTYYAESGYQCRSVSRTAVNAIILTAPAAPVAADSARCGPGTLTLAAASTEQIRWYSASTGGAPLATGSVFVTPSLTSTRTYYAESGNNCRSSTRTAVNAVIRSIPSAPSGSNGFRCGPGSVTVTANSSSQITWYDAPTGGTPLGTGTTFTTPSISATTTYYAGAGTICLSTSRTAVQAVIENTPPAPSASGASRCGPGTLTLTASSAAPVTWYTSASGGVQAGSGASFTTPSISATTTYYAEAGNLCRSLTRTPADAVIISVPPAPVVSDASRCGFGSVTLNAVSPYNVTWYDSLSGGNIVGYGNSLTTPSLNSTTTFYAEATDNCPSATRSAAQAIIHSIPLPPQTQNQSRCGTGSVTLTPLSGDSIRWYADSTLTQLLGSGNTYSTPSINSTTVYYLTSGMTCVSTWTTDTAFILPVSASPAVIDTAICQFNTATLTASSADSLFWYDATGNTLIGFGDLFVTGPLTSDTAYLVRAGSVCPSSFDTLNVTVHPLPQPDLGPDTLFTPSGQLIILDAGNGYNTYLWSTAETTQTIIVSAGGWYEVQVTDVFGCAGTDQQFIEILTGITDGMNRTWSVYPNPASELLYIECKLNINETYRIELHTTDGRIIIRRECIVTGSNALEKLPIGHLQNGLYILKIYSEDSVFSKPVLITR